MIIELWNRISNIGYVKWVFGFLWLPASAIFMNGKTRKNACIHCQHNLDSLK